MALSSSLSMEDWRYSASAKTRTGKVAMSFPKSGMLSIGYNANQSTCLNVTKTYEQMYLKRAYQIRTLCCVGTQDTS